MPPGPATGSLLQVVPEAHPRVRRGSPGHIILVSLHWTECIHHRNAKGFDVYKRKTPHHLHIPHPNICLPLYYKCPICSVLRQLDIPSFPLLCCINYFETCYPFRCSVLCRKPYRHVAQLADVPGRKRELTNHSESFKRR